MELDLITTAVTGLSALGAAFYGVFRMLRRDLREYKNAIAQDGAMNYVINTLREEVKRLAERLVRVESQNMQCRKENATMSMQIIALERKVGGLA